MKKIILLSLLFLTGCSSTGTPFCKSYIFIDKKNNTRTTLFIQKNGNFEKEVVVNNKSYSNKGLYSLDGNILNTYIKDTKIAYQVIEDKDTLIEKKTRKAFSCQ